MKELLALLLATLMLSAVLAGCGGSGSSGDITTSPNVSTTEPTTEAIPNPEYEEIFTSRNIVEMPPVFIMMDSAAFAKVDHDGMIEKMEYGYKDDIVKEMTDTVYYPIADMDEDQKAQLDTGIRTAFEDYTNLNFCTASFDVDENFYTVKLHFTGLDSADNVLKLQDLGLVTGDTSSGLISMEQSESSLLADGFIKR